MSDFKTRRLVETALLLAIGTVLSIFKPFELPFGGGITIFSMLPIVLIAYRYGTAWGLFGAFTGSVLQILTGFKTVSALFLPGDEQVALWKAVLIIAIDYIVAYTALGFGGIFRSRIKSPSRALCAGAVFALSLAYVAHIVSGVIFYGAWAEWFFSQEGFYKIGSVVLKNYSGLSLSVVYSIFYNGLYMLPEIILTALAAAFVGAVPVIASKRDGK
jgi:thiamine transporter